jgi:hypothetical protein
MYLSVFAGLGRCITERKALTSSVIMRPEDFLHFVELDEFADDWESIGLDLIRLLERSFREPAG